MELQEQLTALTGENKKLISIADSINTEKIALDQMLVESIKSCLEAKKASLLKDKSINDLNTQINSLMKEIESLKRPIPDNGQ